MDKEKIWQLFQEQINTKISTMAYNTWFSGLRLLPITDEDIVLIASYRTSCYDNPLFVRYRCLLNLR